MHLFTKYLYSTSLKLHRQLITMLYYLSHTPSPFLLQLVFKQGLAFLPRASCLLGRVSTVVALPPAPKYSKVFTNSSKTSHYKIILNTGYSYLFGMSCFFRSLEPDSDGHMWICFYMHKSIQINKNANKWHLSVKEVNRTWHPAGGSHSS
jgi:hypothetical protein